MLMNLDSFTMISGKSLLRQCSLSSSTATWSFMALGCIDVAVNCNPTRTKKDYK